MVKYSTLFKFLTKPLKISGSAPSASSFNNFTFFDKVNGNPFTANKVGVLNEPGRLVLFPSYLHHEVDINKGNSDRYSISFNTFVKGKFGDNENLTELNI